VYPDGRVCISILHAPGDDPNGYELASERWSPVHTVNFTCQLVTLLFAEYHPAHCTIARLLKSPAHWFQAIFGQKIVNMVVYKWTVGFVLKPETTQDAALCLFCRKNFESCTYFIFRKEAVIVNCSRIGPHQLSHLYLQLSFGNLCNGRLECSPKRESI
jgi:hypothetical protein